MSDTNRNLRPPVVPLERKHAGARRLHAVLVGIDNYQDPNIKPLQFAVADARSIYDSLLRTLRQDQLNVVLLLDAQATRQNVIASIGEDLARTAERDDLVLLFFAGHGAPELNRSATANRYLIMNDTNIDQMFSTALDLETEILRLLERIRSSNIVVFVDSCFSGRAGGRTFEGPKLRDFRDNFRSGGMSLNDLDLGEGRVLISACDDEELALENPNLSHGVFTYCLLQTLLTDSPANPTISLLMLYDEVAAQVRALTNGKQNPVLKGRVRSQTIPYLHRSATD